MDIKNLFNSLQDNFITDESKGELTLQKKSIIWSYDAEDDSEDITNEYDEDNDVFSFESISYEEILEEVSNEYVENLNQYLDEINEIENWTISDPEFKNKKVSLKIFKNNCNN